MPLQISIPTPCHEDWNEMTPADKGRHCSQCSKTVVDFTESSPQQIALYLNEHKSERLCGRFNSKQIEEPIPTPEDFVRQLSHFRIPVMRKVAAIFLFAFSVMAASCNDEVMGKAAIGTPTQSDTSRAIRDTSHNSQNHILVGEPAVSTASIPPPKPPVVVCVPQPPHQLMGDIAVQPVPDTAIEEIPLPPPPVQAPDTAVLMGKIKMP